MSKGFKVSGFGDVNAQLSLLSKAAGKAALTRALRTVAEPMAATMRALAPDDPATAGADLRASIVVSDKLTPRQARLRRRSGSEKAVEMFVGSGGQAGVRGSDPAAVQQEFGNRNHSPLPFARPAWDQHKAAVQEALADEIAKEVAASLGRAISRVRR